MPSEKILYIRCPVDVLNRFYEVKGKVGYGKKSHAKFLATLLDIAEKLHEIRKEMGMEEVDLKQTLDVLITITKRVTSFDKAFQQYAALVNTMYGYGMRT